MTRPLYLLSLVAAFCGVDAGGAHADGSGSEQSGGHVYGVALGVNATTLSGNGFSDTNTHLSLGLGAFLAVRVAGELRIQPELLMTEKGADRKDASNADANEGLLYLQLPVFARYDVPLSNIVRLFGFGGPALGYVIDSKRTPRDELRQFDVSAVAGFGVNIDPGDHEILVHLRGEIGFLNQLDRPDKGRARNRGISLMAGVTM